MRTLVVLLLLGLAADASQRRLLEWRDDVTLWRAAVVLTDAPRPALRLAWDAAAMGHGREAAGWDAEAIRRLQRSPNAAMTYVLRMQLRWIDGVLRVPVCGAPPWASYC